MTSCSETDSFYIYSARRGATVIAGDDAGRAINSVFEHLRGGKTPEMFMPDHESGIQAEQTAKAIYGM